MGGRLSGLGMGRSGRFALTVSLAIVCWVLAVAAMAPTAMAQQRREREPNSVYAARRAKLAAEVDAPIVLWGYTGREEITGWSIFAQEENFYYLAGHNEEGAALVIFPSKGGSAEGKSEILFLPPKNTAQEKWNGVRMSPTDPGIEAKTGFASVQPISELTSTLQKLGT